MSSKFWNYLFKRWSRPGSNWRPSACKADVITTTPRDQGIKHKAENVVLSATGINIYVSIFISMAVQMPIENETPY